MPRPNPRAMMPPVEVPAIKSKYDAKGDLSVSWTAARNAASNTPLMPPPSKDRILNTKASLGALSCGNSILSSAMPLTSSQPEFVVEQPFGSPRNKSGRYAHPGFPLLLLVQTQAALTEDVDHFVIFHLYSQYGLPDPYLRVVAPAIDDLNC